MSVRKPQQAGFTPWFTYQAIEWLEQFLAMRRAQVFEYGAGVSTLWYAARSQAVICVEHKAVWRDWVLQRRDSANTRLKLLWREPTQEHCPNYASSESTELCYRDYVETVLAYPDEAFDLISVDGRARNACLRVARAKVKPGGALLLDNSERPEYAPGIALMAEWEPQVFAGAGPLLRQAWQTTVWLKPQ